jgi:hypothetical protein
MESASIIVAAQMVFYLNLDGLDLPDFLWAPRAVFFLPLTNNYRETE